MIKSCLYLYWAVLSEHFTHLKISSYGKEHLTMLNNRYKNYFIYIVRTSEKCYQVYITYKFRILNFSFRSCTGVIDLLKNIDSGGFNICFK